MKSCKIVACSLLLFAALLTGLWAARASSTDGALYQRFALQMHGGKKDPVALTQVKQKVGRAYWFLNKPEKLVIRVSYPGSQVYRDHGLVEEMFELSAESIQGFCKNTLRAHKGRLDYERNLFIMQEAQLESHKKKGRLCQASAQDVALDLRSSSPTFVARDIKAEICP